MSGIQPVKSNKVERVLNFKEQTPEKYIYKLLKKNDQLHEGTPVYNPYYSIPNPVNVFHNGNVRQMRYIDGHPSVWVDEQKDLPESMLISSNNTIAFANGEFEVLAGEQNKKFFLDHHPLNEGVTKKVKPSMPIYKMLDEAKDNIKRIELLKLKRKASDHAWEVSDEDMLPHARFLNIPIVDDRTGVNRDPSVIRTDYVERAEKDPKTFVETMENESLQLRFSVQKLIDDGSIKYNKETGLAQWRAGSKNITNIPDNVDVAEFLATFTTTDEGSEFNAALKKALS